MASWPFAPGTPSPILQSPNRRDLATVSPDGHSLIYRSLENGRNADLYVQQLPNGQRWQITMTGGGDPQWRGDGREIFFTNDRSIMAADVSAERGPGPPRKLFSIERAESAGRNRFVVSKDGNRFLVVTPENAKDPTLTPFVVILNWQRLLEDR